MGDDEHHWMQKAFSHSHGQFKAKAEKAGMSTEAYAEKEKHDPHASTHTKRQANLAMLGHKYGGGHHHAPAHQRPAHNAHGYGHEPHQHHGHHRHSGHPQAHRIGHK